MTGPEHYAAGERLAKAAEAHAAHATDALVLATLSQAHFTAALAAATAIPEPREESTASLRSAWYDVAGRS